MEVHHHPNVEKKGFKEYFLEFLMIFFAVTMGFFAESIRDKITDHSREREYMYSVIRDLQSDTALINNAISQNSGYYKTDSVFLKNLSKARKDSIAFKKTFTLYPGTEYFNTEFYDSKTFDELKSTGDIRLIKSKKVFDALSYYYQRVEKLKILRDEIHTGLEYSYQHADRAIDIYSFQNNYPSWQDAFKDREKLITNDDGLFREYHNALYGVSIGYGEYDNDIAVLKKEAVQLMKVIGKEYNFKI